jgi:membrane protein
MSDSPTVRRTRLRIGGIGKAATRSALDARRSTVGLVKSVNAEAQRSRLPQMAAALAFRTIFGMIPVMVVALVALRFFTTDEDIAAALNNALRFTGLSQIEVAPAEMGPFPEDYYLAHPQTAAGAAAVTTPTDAEATRLDQWIRSLVQRVSSINFKAVSLVGLAALLYAAIAMLVEIERAFNQVYRVPIGRSWARRVTQYWTLLTLGSIGLAATFYVGQRFTAWLGSVTRFGAQDNERQVSIVLLGYLTTVAISTSMLLLAYTVVPNTRVKLRPALAGALLAALLWEAGKLGFTQYLHFSRGYARLYGSIALIPLFMLWVYVTWLIVLVGLQFAYYLQHGRQKTVAQPSEALGPAIVDPGSSLAVMGALARRFEDGRPALPKDLAHELGLQEGIARQILSALAEAGHVLRVPQGERDAYSLARPPDRTSAVEVLAIGEALANPSGKAPEGIAESLRLARTELVRGKSLGQVMAEAGYRVAPSGTEKQGVAEVGGRPSVA